MKLPVLLAAFSCFVGIARADTIAVIETLDGSRLNGSLSLSKLPLKTSFTTVQLKLEDIESIAAKDENTAQIRFKNGDSLSGKISLLELKLITSFSSVRIPLKNLKSVLLRAAPDKNSPKDSIFLVSASFGGPSESALAHIKGKCQGKQRACIYLVHHDFLGDPLPYASKNFTVEWTCGSDPSLKKFTYGTNGDPNPNAANNADAMEIQLHCP